MAKYDITSEMLIQAVKAYYKNDFDTMLNWMHPNVTFLFTGKNQFVEGRKQLKALIEQHGRAIEARPVTYEILGISKCRGCKSRGGSKEAH